MNKKVLAMICFLALLTLGLTACKGNRNKVQAPTETEAAMAVTEEVKETEAAETGAAETTEATEAVDATEETTAPTE